MNPLFRKILFLTFVAAFFIITPLVTFYAAGYKFSLSWPIKANQLFQKTGALVLDTQPAGAKIYLNSEPRQQIIGKYLGGNNTFVLTPAKIKNLLPGEYDVKFEMEGYWPWEKKLRVNPGQSTFAEDVVLFRKNLPVQIFNLIPQNKNFSSQPARFISQSPDKNGFIAGNESEISFIDENGTVKSKTEAKDLINPNNVATWSADGKKVIINNYLFDTESGDLKALESFIGQKVLSAKFDLNNPDILYFQNSNSLNQYTISTKSIDPIINGQFSDYLINGDRIYLIVQNENSTKLKVYSHKNGSLLREIDFPNSPEVLILNPNSDQLKASNKNLLNLFDSKHEILYIVDPLSQTSPLKEIINNIKYINWVDNNTLLYANDFEVWFLDLNNNKKTILTRISSPITGIVWHPSKNYVIFTTDKSVNVIELDEREKRNVTELASIDQIYSPYLDSKGKVLYFGGKIGNQEGIYKLEIQ